MQHKVTGARPRRGGEAHFCAGSTRLRDGEPHDSTKRRAVLLPGAAQPLIKVVGVKFGREIAEVVNHRSRYLVIRRCLARNRGGGMLDPPRSGAVGAHFDLTRLLIASKRRDKNGTVSHLQQLMKTELADHPGTVF